MPEVSALSIVLHVLAKALLALAAALAAIGALAWVYA
jgi:hypothetical protein